jgi:hypothetical protein
MLKITRQIGRKSYSAFLVLAEDTTRFLGNGEASTRFLGTGPFSPKRDQP